MKKHFGTQEPENMSPEVTGDPLSKKRATKKRRFSRKDDIEEHFAEEMGAMNSLGLVMNLMEMRRKKQ